MKSLYHFYFETCSRIFILFISAALIFTSSCGTQSRIERVIIPSDKFVDKQGVMVDPFLKLHMENGDLYVFSKWEMSEDESIVGNGKHLDSNRETLSEGDFNIPLNQIVLAETNKINDSGASGVLIALTVITGIFTIVCITNPKACFGSCPTFYAYDGDDYIVQSEGFSASILPCLEERDVDALYRVKPLSENFEIQLRNEAYETHVIRSANILALPKLEGGRVFSSPEGEFYQTKNIFEASSVITAEGDCSEMLCTFDGNERFSATDSTNLAEKEIIDLTFNNVSSDQLGLVIASRQTLLTTFLLYQTLAYMGSSASDWMAELERNSSVYSKIVGGTNPVLGTIEVLIKNNSGEWEKAGDVGETGPIATDIKILPFKNLNFSEQRELNNNQLEIRLRMTKGLWRIDYTALAELGDRIDPLVLEPTSSFPEKVNSSRIVELLTNPDSVLITLPGDQYFLNYKLPENYTEYELFMESQGYYLEWMRNEWLVEEDPAKVYQMLLNPDEYYKSLAPQFKKVEAEMEQTFWSSKYVYP